MPRILLADDDPGVRKLVALTLQLGGHDVTSVADGGAAIEQVAAAAAAAPTGDADGPFDLVVLDWMMPIADGIDVCRAIRQDPATAGLPVVLLSAKAQADDVATGLAAGADRYVVKPFEPDDLLAVVAELLARA
jgi:two-component system response regulator MtrA